MIIEYSDNGRITHIINDPVPEGMEQVLNDNNCRFIVISGADGASDLNALRDCFIDNQTVHLRPRFTLPDTVTVLANGIDEYTVTGLPAGTVVKVNGETHIIDGDFIIASDMPAEYEMEFECWPYIPHTMKVLANAS